MQLKQFPKLEDWVHDSGRMLAVGDAAHPLQVSSVVQFLNWKD
jgi:hypothetical protein